MGIITFGPNKDWYKANWRFRRLMRDTRATRPTDAEFQEELIQADAFQALILEEIDLDLRLRILDSMRAAAQSVINDAGGALRGDMDEEGYAMYRKTLTELIQPEKGVRLTYRGFSGPVGGPDPLRSLPLSDGL
jgi:hypothetical protein